MLDDLDPAAIVADPAVPAAVVRSATGAASSWRRRSTRPSRAAPTLDGSEARPEEVGVLCYTSGTTGEPRGVMIRNASLVRNAAMFAHLFQSGPDSATAVVCPLFHNTGYNDGLAHMLLANGRVDVPRRFDPPAVARALAEGRYTFLIGVPTIYGRMLRPARVRRRRPRASAPWFAYGGAPMPGPLAARLTGSSPAPAS